MASTSVEADSMPSGASPIASALDEISGIISGAAGGVVAAGRAARRAGLRRADRAGEAAFRPVIFRAAGFFPDDFVVVFRAALFFVLERALDFDPPDFFAALFLLPPRFPPADFEAPFFELFLAAIFFAMQPP